jgi:glycosyltransferase involved in cell wall biosynthesis
MKVLVFTTLYPNNVWPNHGVFVKERMAQFATIEGCDVKVVAPIPYFPPIKANWRWWFSQVAQSEVRDGIEIYHPRYCMIPKLGMTLHGVMMFLSVLGTLKKLRRNFNFDLIDAHFVYPDGFAAALLSMYFKKPLVITARGSDINLNSKFAIIRRLIQYTLRRATQIISVCSALREAMICLGIPGEKIVVIPNGVDVKKFYRVAKHEARKKLSLPEDSKIILSVGSLIPRKGFDQIIKSLKILREKHRFCNLSLVIVGDGPSQTELKRLVLSLGLGDSVRFMGAIAHAELYLWYSAVDLFCLASSREGWPNVLLESLACGTPVVATNIWGTPEVIQSDQLGLLTERSEDRIADALAIALRKSWSPDDLIAYASSHTWERAAIAIHHVFEEVLQRGPNPSHEGAVCYTTSAFTVPKRKDAAAFDSSED